MEYSLFKAHLHGFYEKIIKYNIKYWKILQLWPEASV